MAKNDDPDETAAPDAVEEVATPAVAPLEIQLQPTGRIVGIIKRNWRTYVCHLDRSSLPPAALTSITSTPIFASPVSRSIPRIRILTRQAAHLSTQKFLVSIDRWPVTSKYPEGHFVRALGEVGSKEGELESLLEEWEVPYRPFSAGILECLPIEGEKWVVPSKDDDPKKVWAGREDFREMIVCSIDPPGECGPSGCGDVELTTRLSRLSRY
jgi:exosome complex exonuclease DIS3/RRP44